MTNMEDGLSAQQRSFRAAMIADLMKAYSSRGCCNRVVLEGGSDFKRMVYPTLIMYWQAAYPERKPPVGAGAGANARKW